MVSGFFTSPCDNCRMSSAVARPIRRSSKKLTSSTLVIPWGRADHGVERVWRGSGSSDFLYAARLAPGQVDAQFLGGAEDVFVGVAHLDRGSVAGQHLDVEAQRLHFLDQYLEALRDTRLRYVLAL